MESARHSVIANNLANVNTTGFRKDLAVVEARNAEAVEDGLFAYATPMDAMGGGALVSETYTNTMQGPIHVTNNPFDFAIEGKGFFPVTDGAGVSYTRAGTFVRDKEGRLAMPDGIHFLASASGNPVTVPLEGELSVAGDGTIAADGSAVGKIDVVAFANERALRKIGANLYASTGETPAVYAGRIEQGALEMSSVSPAEELSKMILASRGYEMNMQFIRMQDQTLADLVTLARMPM